MKLRPLGRNVIIKPVAASKVSSGGIHLVKGEQKGALEGMVLAFGPGVTELAPGDVHVLYDKHAPTVDAGEGLLVVNIDHVHAVLR